MGPRQVRTRINRELNRLHAYFCVLSFLYTLQYSVQKAYLQWRFVRAVVRRAAPLRRVLYAGPRRTHGRKCAAKEPKGKKIWGQSDSPPRCRLHYSPPRPCMDGHRNCSRLQLQLNACPGSARWGDCLL